MPRSLTPETFGPEYPELLRKAQRSVPEGLTLPFPTKREAHLFRLRIYAYFRALRSDGRAKDLIALANYFSIILDTHPHPQLRIIPSSSLADRKYLRNFLDMKEAPVPGEPLTAGSLSERLKDLRERKSK